MYKFKKQKNPTEMITIMVNDFINHVNLFLETKDYINVAIATGSTLEPFISCLKDTDVPFEKMNLYIVDDYAGISFTDNLSCSIDLYNLFDDKIYSFKSVKCFSTDNYVNDLRIYNEELTKNGLDICVLGVGIDGHVGFCYPPIMKYNKKFYEIIPLSIKRKKEHVMNGWFHDVVDVPNYVITLTLWGISCSSCILVGAILEDKIKIIKKMYKKKTSISDCPILYLSKHNNITVYLG